ncbi:MAG: glycosyltransferase, partial [Fischerella sp.]|nr:glycosyltransferase [Fischerella sp.]
MSKLKVAMLGDSLSHNGGIVTVEKLILRYAPPEVEIQHIATHEAGSMAHRIKLFGQGLAAFLLRLLRERTDLVHIHLADGGSILRKVIIAVIALLFQKAILIHTNGPAFHITYSKLPKCIQQCLSWIFSRCHGFIVMSQSWKDFYVPNLGLDEKRVYILPNPIELPAEVPQRSNVDKVSVVFLGRIGQRKGAFDLIQAFAHLPSGLLDLSLIHI